MKRFRVFHLTEYLFSDFVDLCPHTLRLRPRESHELRLESSQLNIFPAPVLRWQQDVEGNSVCIASFSNNTKKLSIASELFIQQFNLAPLDFVIDGSAIHYPFLYSQGDLVMLSPYLLNTPLNNTLALSVINQVYNPSEPIQTIVLLERLNLQIHKLISYKIREEEGVQNALQTLQLGSGSCRDLANLLMQLTRRLGMASRFVSGYLFTNSSGELPESTHAWVEVFIPGAGWKGFDPTLGIMAGPQHIAVAVSRLADSVPPIAGAFIGNAKAKMNVQVFVQELK